MIDALDLRYLNSAKFAFRLGELFGAMQRVDTARLAMTYGTSGGAGLLAAMMRALECEERELRGFLAAFDAFNPADTEGSKIAEKLGLPIGVFAVAHVDRERGRTGFSFSMLPEEGPRPS